MLTDVTVIIQVCLRWSLALTDVTDVTDIIQVCFASALGAFNEADVSAIMQQPIRLPVSTIQRQIFGGAEGQQPQLQASGNRPGGGTPTPEKKVRLLVLMRTKSQIV